MKKIHLLLLCVFAFQGLKAQTKFEVSGIVKDSTDNPIVGAAINLTSMVDTTNATTNLDGIFVFNNIKASEFVITITALGYQPIKRRYINDPKATRIVLDPIILKSDSRVLNEVVVNGTPDVTVKEDTLEYRAGAYKLKENALAEDLLKKLPGIEVDRDGNVTAQGKTITKVRINGKDFFGGDVKTATQQLPADIIEKVQVIDDYGDQANITGVKDGDPDKILNFTIRKDKNKGYLARGIAGGGDKDRYQGSLFAASFNNDQQLALLGNFNNTNANVFSLTQGASSGGGGRRRGGGSFGGGGGSDGLTNVNSIGFNYRDQWGPKVTAYGSYSFSNKDNNTTSTNLNSLLGGGVVLNNNTFDNSNTKNNNHRVNLNIEYKIDSLNYLKVTPNVSFGSSNSIYNSNFTNQSPRTDTYGNSVNNSDNANPNYGLDFLYNHRFGTKARNLSLDGSLNATSSSQDQSYLYIVNNTQTQQLERYQNQIINGDNKNDNVKLRLSYTEPITKTKNLEFNYTYGFARANNNRLVQNSDVSGQDPVFDSDLSNQYIFDYITNRFGANYRVNQKKYNYTLGFAVQPATLTGTNNTNRSVTNIFPNARFSYKFSKTRELSFNYNGRSSQPSYNQLQPITDKSNAQYYTTGNNQLLPEFTNSASIRYNNFDFASGNVLFTNISYNFTKDKIVTNVINYPFPSDSTVLQNTTYQNADGYYTINGFYAFSKPFEDKKYVIRLRGSAFYNNNISFVDNNKNIGKNLILSQRLDFQINPNDWLELSPSGTYTYNRNNNSLNTRANSEVNSFTTSFDSKIYFLKSWVWGTSLDKTFNSGYNSISTNPFIINTYLEKDFFKDKKGSLKLQAFDLLNQSTSLSYTATSTSTILSQSNKLSRYFMLSFTFNISKFAGNTTTIPDMGGERRHYRRDNNEER
ncbi:outer membrane beta-barrel protein [Pedobacter sp. SD-b]|uniref:Outer membrane beta-barrel protein n=2 Tax=Pedobacter segetis TaxID=2793069 RepID=A0ABS1BGI2_9SPHI|nr:outer membrane beta-barrel protein [Pedobacter segetis]